LLIERLEQHGWDIREAAAAAGISVRAARTWLARWRAEGESGLLDRSSAPKTVANKTDEARIACIAALRRLRMTGPEIAETLGMALSTVSGILTSINMGRLGRLGLEPSQRYERARPGELIHIDIKKLGRILSPGHRLTGNRRSRKTSGSRSLGVAGWEFVHVAIDDATRLAYVELLADETAVTAVGFLRRAKAFFESYGMTVDAVMTDNGGAYRSTIHALACKALGLKHLRTRAYRPQTNGKAERFIRTMLGG
jgi:transposase InsO family protein